MTKKQRESHERSDGNDAVLMDQELLSKVVADEKRQRYRFFLWDLEELRRYSYGEHWITDDPLYLACKTASLVHKFFMDEMRFVDAINRERRLKITFFVEDPLGDKILDKDQLLRYEVMMINGVSYQYRDFVRAMRNFQGGVHIDNPEKNETMENLSRWVKCYHAMFRLGRIVYSGLIPLKERIEHDLAQQNLS